MPLSQPVKTLATEIFSGLATPRSLTAEILLRYGEWDQLATLAIDPNHYRSSEAYWADAQATSLLKKYEDLPTSFDKKKVAEDLFILCERQCLRTNRHLYPYINDGLLSRDFDPQNYSDVHRYIWRVRKIIADILGPCPDLVEGRFGPGATFGDKGTLTTIPDKMSSAPTFTSDAWPFLVPWSGTMWASACVVIGKVPKSVPGNRFTTVPKDSTRDRGIAIEPSLNVFYQLAYGKVIRDRLRRWGINLNEGQDIHRALAREASRKGHLATLDLNNASDTVSRNLVKLLLPRRWFSLLDSLRSKKTFFKDQWHLLEKFSSMGNGFTFELETLIFLGICLGACPEGVAGIDVFAFGDDIIIPSNRSKDVISALNFFGMTVNKGKSFTDGLFRESCGGDFFRGNRVRPYYLKKNPDQPHKVISVLNGLRASCSENEYRWLSIYPSWNFALKWLPTNVRRLRGPLALGDIVIHDEQRRWVSSWRDGIRRLKTYQPSKFQFVDLKGFSPDVVLATAVYGMPVGAGQILARDPVLDYSIQEVCYS